MIISIKSKKCKFSPLVFVYTMDFICVICFFVYIIYSTINESNEINDPSQPISHSVASIKNSSGGEQGFTVFMVVMMSIFFIFMLIYMSWIWIISFRLAKYFGRSKKKLNSTDIKYVDMFSNDIRVIQGNTRPSGRVRRLQYGMTPDGSFERRPGAPRGI